MIVCVFDFWSVFQCGKGQLMFGQGFGVELNVAKLPVTTGIFVINCSLNRYMTFGQKSIVERQIYFRFWATDLQLWAPKFWSFRKCLRKLMEESFNRTPAEKQRPGKPHWMWGPQCHSQSYIELDIKFYNWSRVNILLTGSNRVRVDSLNFWT